MGTETVQYNTKDRDKAHAMKKKLATKGYESGVLAGTSKTGKKLGYIAYGDKPKKGRSTHRLIKGY